MSRPKPDDSNDFAPFPTTQWTLLGNAGDRLNEGQRDALNEVLTQYWPAIRAHLVTKKRFDRNDADDLVQGFIKDRLLESDLLAVADRDRGMFRSLLAKSLENYVAKEIRRRNAKKRGPDRAVSLNAEEQAEPRSVTKTPLQEVVAEQARDVLSDVLARMERECRANGRTDLWELLEARIVKPLLEGIEPLDYDQIQQQLNFSSTTQAQNALVTAKRMFIRTMRETLSQHGASETDVEEEIRDLESCLAAY